MIDLFKVGVHIGMTTNSGQVLAAMLRQLTGVQTAQKTINQNFQIMATVAAGAMAAIGGAAALKGLWSLVEGSRRLNDELTKTKSLGGEFEKTLTTTRAVAFSTSADVRTFSPSAVVKAQRELATQVPDQAQANALLPYILRAATVTSQVTGEKPEDMIQNMAKILDIRGQIFSEGPDGKKFIDPAKFMPELEMMSASLRMYAGIISSKGMLAAAMQAAVPAKGMTGPAFYADLMEAASASSPHRVGTATTSLFSQIIGGTMPLHVAHEMQRMGLMKEGEWSTGRGGRVLLGPAVSERFGQAMKSPIEFITGELNDLMTKKGMNDDQKLLEVFRLFGRQTTQRLVAEALSSEPQYARSRAIFSGVKPIGEAWEMLQRENLNFNLTGVTAAWQGFIEALGDAGVPMAISILQQITGALHELTRLIEAHPNAAAWLLGIAGGLAAMAAVGGAVTLLGAGLSGLSAAFGAFSAGGAAAGALMLLTGPGGLIALALGIEMLGGKIAGLPGWLVHILSGAAAGAGAGALMGGAPGAVIGGVLGGVGGAIGSGTGLGETGLPNLNDRLKNANEDSYFARRFGRPPPLPPAAPREVGPGGMLGRISYGGDAPRIMGDVYLDGVKVGQWVAKWMAGQTSRPAAGPTAVDTRMTFVAPGGAFA